MSFSHFVAASGVNAEIAREILNSDINCRQDYGIIYQAHLSGIIYYSPGSTSGLKKALNFTWPEKTPLKRPKLRHLGPKDDVCQVGFLN